MVAYCNQRDREREERKKERDIETNILGTDRDRQRKKEGDIESNVLRNINKH